MEYSAAYLILPQLVTKLAVAMLNFSTEQQNELNELNEKHNRELKSLEN